MLVQEVSFHAVKVGVWCVMSTLTNTGTVVSSEAIKLQWYVTHILTSLSEHLSN